MSLSPALYVLQISQESMLSSHNCCCNCELVLRNFVFRPWLTSFGAYVYYDYQKLFIILLIK